MVLYSHGYHFCKRVRGYHDLVILASHEVRNMYVGRSKPHELLKSSARSQRAMDVRL